MQTECVQERRQALHNAKDEHSQLEPHKEQETEPENGADPACITEPASECHIPEHLGELRVRERERPKTEV